MILSMRSFQTYMAAFFVSWWKTSGLTSRRSQRGWALAVLPTGRGLLCGLVLTWLSLVRYGGADTV